ncbi:MAG: hypothetical protein Q9M35_12785 [Rhodothermus sp.]|nr:hypothetical protein [Rhodothermus sp.]
MTSAKKGWHVWQRPARYSWWLCWLLGASPVTGQTLDTLQLEPRVAFIEAQALAADPTGRLYVADAGRHAVIRLTPDGRVEDILGGPGSGPGRFDTPVAVDAQTGLSFWVAEAGNQRLQRLSWRGLPLETVPLPTGLVPAAVRQLGRWLFVLDAAAARLWRRGPDGRWQVSDALDRGALQQPVALTIGPGSRLLIADAARRVVLAYDYRGTFERPWIASLPGTPQAMDAQGDTLWLVIDSQLMRYLPDGQLQVMGWLPFDVVGMIWQGRRGWILSRQHLYYAQLSVPGRR